MSIEQKKKVLQHIEPWLIDLAVASYEKAKVTKEHKFFDYDFAFLDLAVDHLTNENYTFAIDCTDYTNGIFWYHVSVGRWRITGASEASIQLLYEWFCHPLYLPEARDVWRENGLVVLIGGEKRAKENLANELYNYPNTSRKNQMVLQFSAISRQLDEIRLPKNLQNDELKDLVKHLSNYKIRIHQVDIRKRVATSLNIFSYDTDRILRSEAQRNLFSDLGSLSWSVPFADKEKVRNSELNIVRFTKLSATPIRSPIKKTTSKIKKYKSPSKVKKKK